MNDRKSGQSEMIARLVQGGILLPPVIITKREVEPVAQAGRRADLRIEAGLPDEKERFQFVLEVKSLSTPLVVSMAMAQVKASTAAGDQPMIMVPYLSPERLADLEREKVSGIDLCGNGVIIVPGRLYVLRTGQPNAYPDSRPLSNPYRGRSAMVARMLLSRPQWSSLGELRTALQKAGTDLSLSQISKAVQALNDDLIISKSAGTITLQDPTRLLDKLGGAWKSPGIHERQALRLPPGKDIAALSSVAGLKWALTGEASVTRYATFAQGGPRRVAVSSMPLALSPLGGTPEPVPNFADVELIQTDEAGFFFGNEVDAEGLRWASRLQTWLELQAGDGRQQAAARDVRSQILQGIKP